MDTSDKKYFKKFIKNHVTFKNIQNSTKNYKKFTYKSKNLQKSKNCTKFKSQKFTILQNPKNLHKKQQNCNFLTILNLCFEIFSFETR